MSLLVDQSGQPGPATWKNGRYPKGEADYPVGCVSWYEAAAYARFTGKGKSKGSGPILFGPRNAVGRVAFGNLRIADSWPRRRSR
jgi:hypothetical protein